MNWKENINTIKEIYPGLFQIILDFATIAFLKHILSDSFKFVWVYSFKTKDCLDWKNYELPLIHNTKLNNVIARDISFSLVLPTNEFKEMLVSLGPGITLAQINKLPPDYLNPSKISGKTRYDLLQKECDYLFEIDIPGATDYGILRSSNKDYLEYLLNNKEINWTDLP
jgi:hypothetical protein